jgi:hypothetical protein
MGLEAYITGGDEGKEACAPNAITWGIFIIVGLLLLNAMGKVTLKQGFGSWQGASVRGAEQDQVGLYGREGFATDAALDATFQGGDGSKFADLLNAAAKDDGDSADSEGAGGDPSPFDDVVQEGGYGMYQSVYDSEARAPLEKDALKKKWLSDGAAAADNFWKLMGGDNACDLPVARVAFAEALSLSAANGDIPTGAVKTSFADNLSQ